MDSNVEIAAPLVGDVGSCVSALLEGMDGTWPAPPADWIGAVKAKKDENIAKMAPRLMKNSAPMDFHSALGALRTVIKERPDAILVNEGANTLDLARGVIDMYKPRKRLDVGTWGVMGIGMGFAIGAAIETGKPVSPSKATAPLASPAWRSRRSAVTTCRFASLSSTTTAFIAAPTSI